MNSYLEALQASKPLLIVNLVAAIVAGIFISEAIRALRDSWYDRREERREQEADTDSTRIMAGLYPDRYEETESNDAYFQRTTDGKGFRLNERWRELVNETKPRSPEMVAEAVYLENTWAFNPIRDEQSNTSQETEPINEPYQPWTEDEKKVPGRHRSTDDEERALAQRRVLLTETGSFKTLKRRELTSA